MGASLFGNIWSATHKGASPDTRSNFDVLNNNANADARIPVIYGTRKWGGYEAWHSASNDKKTLTKDVVLCEGPIDSANSVKANNIAMSSLSGCSYVFHNGSPTQDPPDNYDTVGGYKNCAWIRAQLESSDQLQGSNPTITCVIRGLLVKDTRNNTTAYSDNPAMCLRDYLLNKRYGLGRWLTADMIDEDSFKECADYCDQVIAYYVPNSLSTYDAVQNKITALQQELDANPGYSQETRDNIQDSIDSLKKSLLTISTQPVSQELVTSPRYTLNIILADKQSHIDDIQQILAAFGGFLVFNGDKISLRMEKDTSVSYAFTDDTICSTKEGRVDIKWETTSLADAPNQYIMKFYDPKNEYVGVKVQVNDFGNQRERGKVVTKEITLDGITNQSQALRLGRMYLAKTKMCYGVCTFSTGTYAMHLQPGDIITITHGILRDQPMRILQTAEENGKWTIKCQQWNSSIYSDYLDQAITYKNYTTVSNAFTDTVPDVTGVTFDQNYYIQRDGSTVSTITGTCAIPSYLFYDSCDIYVSTGGDYSYLMNTATGEFTMQGAIVRQVYTFKIVVVNSAGRKSSGFISHQVMCTGESVRGLTIVQIEGGLRLTWIASDDPSVVGYDVYRGPDGASITDCSKIATALASTSLDVEQADAGSWIFYVMAVDSTGKQVGRVISKTVTIGLPGPVLSAKAVTMYRQYQDGTTGYDIIVTYELPKNKLIRTGLVYYKVDHIDVTELGAIPEGVPADELGYSADWKYAGNGENKVVIPAAQLGDTYRLKIVAQDTTGHVSSEEDARYVTISIVAKTAIPNTPQNFRYNFSVVGGFQLSWDAVTNTDVDFYECRINDAPGASNGLLARVTGVSALVNLTTRRGTLYLYAHNWTGKYSYPAKAEYRKDAPAAPKSIIIKEAPRAAIITVPPIPDGADGVKLWITGDETMAIDIGGTITYTYTGDPNIYTITACYYDVFGDGEQSPEYYFTIRPTFKEEWIADESISLKKVDSVVKDAVAKAQQATTDIVELKKSDTDITATVANMNTSMTSQINQQADRITSVVTNLGKAPADSGYSAITQLQDAVNLRVVKGDVINQINLTAEGTTIDGQYLHVTGMTKFDDSVIVDRMLAANAVTANKISAGAVTADKLSVDSLSAVSAILGSVTAGDITGSTFRNASNTFSIDADGNIVGAKITGSSLELSSADLKAAGLKISAVTFMKGAISSGGTIPLPDGYTADECIWWAVSGGDYIASIDDNRIVTFRHMKTESETGFISDTLWIDGKGYPFNATYNYVSSEWESGGSGTYYIFGVKK